MNQHNQGKSLLYFLLVTLIFTACDPSATEDQLPGSNNDLTIFFINDPHGRLNNFAKIKHIVDEERATNNVLLLSAGDLFSGNPVVDQFDQRGFPIIDIMNKVGFDLSVLGNHEFDYGLNTLNNRLAQSEFGWICANVNTNGTVLAQPDAFRTLTVGDLKVTLLGLVETNGRPDAIIPATHPWRIEGLSFQRFQNVVPQYRNLKPQEDSDVYVALTHLGTSGDRYLAENFPFFDVIIGGHSNDLNDGTINGIPTLMAGANLSHLGKIELSIRNQQVTGFEVSMIDLNAYPDADQELLADIEEYNNSPEFAEIVGNALTDHDRNEVGCFFTTALKAFMNVDVAIQNNGGIRAEIDQGEVTAFEIYQMDPFNNGSVSFTMTVAEMKNFLQQTRAAIHVTGVQLQRDGDELIVSDDSGNALADNVSLTIGMNDFIPALYDDFFSRADATLTDYTTAESLIEYMKNTNSTLDFEGCNRFFRY